MALARAKGSCDGIVRVGGPASAGRRRTVSDLQPVSRRSRDERCPGGSGWGEALASGRHLGNGAYAATRCAQVAAARRKTEAHRVKREAPCWHRRRAPDSRRPGRRWVEGPVTIREGRAGTEAPASSGFGGRRGGWGLNPVGPARAGQANVGEVEPGSEGSWLCSWAVLIAEAGERSSVEGVLVPVKRSSLTRRLWRRGLAEANAGEAERSSSNG